MLQFTLLSHLLYDSLVLIALRRCVVDRRIILVTLSLLPLHSVLRIVPFRDDLVHIPEHASDESGSLCMMLSVPLHFDSVGSQVREQFPDTIKGLVSHHQQLHLFLLTVDHLIQPLALSQVVFDLRL